ncbi:MAG: hypothetical protein WDN48_17075 [Pseudolabrys sp.]
MDDLHAATELWGVEKGYHDVFGGWHEASPETLSRLVAALSAGRERPASFSTPPANHLRAFQGDGRRVWGLDRAALCAALAAELGARRLHRPQATR